MATPREDFELQVKAEVATDGQEQPSNSETVVTAGPDTHGQEQPPNPETAVTAGPDTHGQEQPPNPETALDMPTDYPEVVDESYSCWLIPDMKTVCYTVCCKYTFGSIPLPQWLKRCCRKCWDLRKKCECCGKKETTEQERRMDNLDYREVNEDSARGDSTCTNLKDCCKSCCSKLCNAAKMCFRKCCISGIKVEENEGIFPSCQTTGWCSCKCEEEPNEAKEEDEIRRGLQFHLKNPLQKWYDSYGICPARYPMKLLFQIFAICLVTAQSYKFGASRSALTKFIQSNKETINTLFLDFGCGDDMTVHSMDNLYHQIQRIADTYYNIQSIGVAPYDYFENPDATRPSGPPLLLVFVEQYIDWRFDASTHDIRLSRGTDTFNITLYNGKNETCFPSSNCTIQAQLEPYVNVSSIGSIRRLTVRFQLTSFFVDQELDTLYTSCVTFHIDILFNNVALSSSIPVEVTAEPTIRDCDTSQKNQHFYDELFMQLGLDIAVIVTMVLYGFLCLCSIIDSLILTCRTYWFFKRKYERWLTCGHVMSLQHFWNYVVLIGNCLVIAGSVLKIILANKVALSVELENCTALILGLGLFFQWCGLLHFFSYFDKFNILLLTLQIAFPSVVRLVVCTGVLYIAFMFLGWLVLGPYHAKFADLSITSEGLFSLINGDDIYATYTGMSQESHGLWVFSKFYLYLFITFFIVVVLSVFIGLITDTYEKLTERYHSRSKGFLNEFAQNGIERMKDKMVFAANPTTNGPTTTQQTEQHQEEEEEEEEERQPNGVPVPVDVPPPSEPN